MKKFALSVTTIACIGLVLYILFLQECKRSPEYNPPEGYVLVTEGFIDSLELITSLPGDTVFRDTGSTHFIKEYIDRPVPVPTVVDSVTNHYADSVKSDTVNFWIEAMIRGELLDWNWKFDITQRDITNTVEIPKPVPLRIEVPVVERGIYAGIKLGGELQEGKFIYGAELDYLNLKHNMYGLRYSRFGEYNIVEFKMGTRILHW